MIDFFIFRSFRNKVTNRVGRSYYSFGGQICTTNALPLVKLRNYVLTNFLISQNFPQCSVVQCMGIHTTFKMLNWEYFDSLYNTDSLPIFQNYLLETVQKVLIDWSTYRKMPIPFNTSEMVLKAHIDWPLENCLVYSTRS